MTHHYEVEITSPLGESRTEFTGYPAALAVFYGSCKAQKDGPGPTPDGQVEIAVHDLTAGHTLKSYIVGKGFQPVEELVGVDILCIIEDPIMGVHDLFVHRPNGTVLMDESLSFLKDGDLEVMFALDILAEAYHRIFAGRTDMPGPSGKS